MKTADKNFAPEEFANCVSQKTNLNKIEELGFTSRGRTMFKLSEEQRG